MSTLGQTPFDPLEVPSFPVRRFTVEEYQRLGEMGVLSEDEDVELIEGWIVPKMNRNPPHDATIEIIQDWLMRHLPAGWRPRIQSGMVTPDSQPEPDLVIVRGDPRERLQRHPGPSDTALVIEVADWSLDFDRKNKARAYARARIPRYWIVNLVDEQIEVFTEPSGPRRRPVFHKQEIYQRDSSIDLVIEGQVIASCRVDDLLP